VVGIGGGSGAGKSLPVERRAALPLGVCVIDLDSCCVDRSHLPTDQHAAANFDESDACDVELLLQNLHHLRTGDTVRKPRYSFHEHARYGFDVIAPAPIILVGGLFTLWWPRVRDELSLKVLVDAPADVRLARRFQHDIRERGRTVDSIVRQYLSTVGAMHERYAEPTRAYADVAVSKAGSIEMAVKVVTGAVEQGMRSAT
jgi:uridine kinase